MDTVIGDIVEHVPVVRGSCLNKEVDRLFQEHNLCEGVVVVEDEKPIGLMMKSKFYQKIGTQYGFNVYMGRSVQLVMSPSPLIVEAERTIVEVCVRSMNRPQDELYDFVIITKNGSYLGVTSIRNLLLAFAEVQSDLARDLNPLTGLPGNRQIEQHLKACLSQPLYSILYLDLDRFKEYNDTYGFNKGDCVIQRTADCVKEALDEEGFSDAFFGHIGGDDFIVILRQHNYEPLCQVIIDKFTQSLSTFYTAEHLEKGYMIGPTREGIVGHIPLTALSIAVLTNETHLFSSIEELSQTASLVKKTCKKNPVSSFCTLKDAVVH